MTDEDRKSGKDVFTCFLNTIYNAANVISEGKVKAKGKVHLYSATTAVYAASAALSSQTGPSTA